MLGIRIAWVAIHFASVLVGMLIAHYSSWQHATMAISLFHMVTGIHRAVTLR